VILWTGRSYIVRLHFVLHILPLINAFF